jgi:hypothetical protein
MSTVNVRSSEGVFTPSQKQERPKFLPLGLRVVGLIFIFAIYPLTELWPSGWAWHSGRSEYLEMIVAVYATLGLFLILAARDPARHLSLISFAIWSSVVHGLVMGVQAVVDPMHIHHLHGDVPILFLLTAVLAYSAPEALRFPFTRSAA